MENKLSNHIVESNEMVTAVEWMEAKLSTLDDWCLIEEWTIEAKEMEKEQIVLANEDCSTNELAEFISGEEYYKETYNK